MRACRVTIVVLLLVGVGLAGTWRFHRGQHLVPRHVYLEFRRADKLIVNMYLRDADAHLADVSFIGEKPEVELLFTRGERASGYAVRGVTGLVFGNVRIAVSEAGVTVGGRRYPLCTMIITRNGEVVLDAAIPEAL